MPILGLFACLGVFGRFGVCLLMDLLTDSPMWLLYLGVLLGPFVQEDAAVVTAASLSVTGAAKTIPLFIIITIGLFLSDIWKYWIGWAAMKNKGGKAFAEKKHIANLSHKDASLISSSINQAIGMLQAGI